MTRLPFMRPVALLVLSCFLVQLAGAAPALAQPNLRSIEIGMGRSTIVAFDGVVKRVSLGHQATADYNVVSKNEVMILGMKPGRTEIYVWLESGEFLTYELHVVDDLADLKAKLAEVIGREAASGITPVLAGPSGRETLVLRGVVGTQAEADAAQDVAELYYKSMNLLEVRRSALAQITPGAPGGAAPDADVTSCIFTLAHATDEAGLAKVLEKFKSPDGIIDVDARSNSIIVSDRGARVQQMKAILEVLDKPMDALETALKKHVLIEAKIIEVTLGNDMTSTIDWIYDTLYSGTNALGTAMNGKVAGLSGGQLGLNLDYGKISSEHFSAKILPQLTKRKSRLITSPTTMTLDGQQAIIEIGDSVPTPGNTTVTNGATTGGAPEYKDAKIHLKVTPYITGGDLVNLDMYIEETSLGDRIEYQTGFFANQISTRKSTNRVIMNDKETLIIGGLIKEDSKFNKSQVPVVGNIPLLKPFFSKESDIKNKRELLIFVSVKIIDSNHPQKIESVRYVNLAKEEMVSGKRERKVFQKQIEKHPGEFPTLLPGDLDGMKAPPCRSAAGAPAPGLAEIPSLSGKLSVHTLKPAPVKAAVAQASPAPPLRSAEAAALLGELKAARAIVPVAAPVAKAGKPVAKAGKPVAKAEKPVAKAEKPVAEVEKPVAKVEKPVAKAENPVAKAAPKKAAVSDPLRSAEARRLLEALKGHGPKPAPEPAPAVVSEPAPAAVPDAPPAPAPKRARGDGKPAVKEEAAAEPKRPDPLDPARIRALARENFMEKVAAVDLLGKHLSDRMDKNEMKNALNALRQSACAPAGGAR